MLILDSLISQKRIYSVHSGSQIASLRNPVINRGNLKIEAFEIAAAGIRFLTVVHSVDIREWNRLGVIIDSEDDLMEVGHDMPKLKALVEDNCQLLEMGVRTQSGKRLGKVSDFAFDPSDYYIKKIYVDKSSIFSILKDPLIIGRESIIDITNKFIIIKDGTIAVRASDVAMEATT